MDHGEAIDAAEEVLEIPNSPPVQQRKRVRKRVARKRRPRKMVQRELIPLCKEEKECMDHEMLGFRGLDIWGFFRIGFVYIFRSVDFLFNRRLYLAFVVEFILFLVLMIPLVIILFFTDVFTVYELDVDNYPFYILNTIGVTLGVVLSLYFLYMLICSDIFRRLSLHTERLMHTTTPDEDFHRLIMLDFCCFQLPHFSDIFSSLTESLDEPRTRDSIESGDDEDEELEPFPPPHKSLGQKIRERRKLDHQRTSTIFAEYGDDGRNSIDDRWLGIVGCVRFTSIFVFTTILESCIPLVLVGFLYIASEVVIIFIPNYTTVGVELVLFLMLYSCITPCVCSFQALKATFLARGPMGYFRALVFLMRPRNAAVLIGFVMGYSVFQMLPFVGVFAPIMALIGMTRLVVHLKHKDAQFGMLREAGKKKQRKYQELQNEEENVDDFVPPEPPRYDNVDFSLNPVPHRAEEFEAGGNIEERREVVGEEHVGEVAEEEMEVFEKLDEEEQMPSPALEPLDVVRKAESVEIEDVNVEVPKKTTLFEKVKQETEKKEGKSSSSSSSSSGEEKGEDGM